MYTRPPGLADDDVLDAVRRGWGIDADEVAYAPVGFGSHHWTASGPGGRWFVTVDDLEAKRREESETTVVAGRRLEAALETAAALQRAGLDFVIAPQRTAAGSCLWPIGERWAVALYPFIDGDTNGFGPYEDRAARRSVVDRLAAIHAATDAAVAFAPVDDLRIPRRQGLAAAIASPDEPWGSGPYAEPARRLLADNGPALVDVLARFDELAISVTAARDRFVVTHGEPHRGNTITTPSGVVLIDWDTAALAPPERDLWMLVDEDPTVRAGYERASGRLVEDDGLAAYRLWWDLCEVSLYVGDLRAEHEDTEDVRAGWAGLQRYLDPARWIWLTG